MMHIATRFPLAVAAIAVALIAHAAETSAAEPVGSPVETAMIERSELSVHFRDNSTSPKVLSGVDALFNTKHAPGFDAFDPDGKGSSAGLNFEHIISGHESTHNKFTPRVGRYELRRLDDGRSVRLTRAATDSPWKVASTFDYTVTEPYYIDFAFRCVPQDAALFAPEGYAIFFFANYMNDVEDVGINFRGIDKPSGLEQWIRADAPKAHPDWNGGGTYRHEKAAELNYDKKQQFVLNNWSYNYPRFTRPFYFGKAAHGMTLILMFDRTWSETDEVRFSLFKFKLPKHPRPAWDFQYVIHQAEAGREYGFRGRLVWKKFVSSDDCLREYERWSDDLKIKAAGPAR